MELEIDGAMQQAPQSGRQAVLMRYLYSSYRRLSSKH